MVEGEVERKRLTDATRQEVEREPSLQVSNDSIVR